MGLPSDISTLVLTYATEPIYTLPKWIPKNKHRSIYLSCLDNPRAFRWIKKNWAGFVNKSELLKNPHPSMEKLIRGLEFGKLGMSILANNIRFDYTKLSPELFIDNLGYVFRFCPDHEFITKCVKLNMRIDWAQYAHILANTNNDVISKCLTFKIFEKILKREPKGWGYSIKNTNSVVLGFIDKYLANNKHIAQQYMEKLSSNPSNKALDILEKYPKLINSNILLANPNPRAYELFIKYFPDEKINIFRTGPNCEWAFPLIKQKVEKYINNKLHDSDSDDDTLKVYIEKLILNTNPKVVELLDGYMDLIKSTQNINTISWNATPKIIQWIRSHSKYVGYHEDDTSTEHINIYTLAYNNIYLLQDNYLGRFPRKLNKFLGYL